MMILNTEKKNGSSKFSYENFFNNYFKRRALSKSEAKYLDELGRGIDRHLDLMAAWLQSDEAKQLKYESDEKIKDFFESSGIQDDYDELIHSNAESTDVFMNRFYIAGAKRGFNDIGRTLCFTRADEHSLNVIRQYNFEKVKNLNHDLMESVKETTFHSLASGESYNKTISALKELPLEPIGNLSVSARARMIAITERARAVNTGTLQAYLDYGVLKCEIITAGSGVCDECLDLESSNPYATEEVDSLLPVHPMCRCAWAPVINSIDDISDEPLDNPSFAVSSISD
jgi:hypothetical protein